MFRWLTDQYPNILNRRLGSNKDNIPPIDNFYLDMNGIIHPCTHGNNEQEITLLDETIMFKKIFGYVDPRARDYAVNLGIAFALGCLAALLVGAFIARNLSTSFLNFGIGPQAFGAENRDIFPREKDEVISGSMRPSGWFTGR